MKGLGLGLGLTLRRLFTGGGEAPPDLFTGMDFSLSGNSGYLSLILEDF